MWVFSFSVVLKRKERREWEGVQGIVVGIEAAGWQRWLNGRIRVANEVVKWG